MQLDSFYLSIIQVTLMDAIAIGAAAGLLASAYFGFKLKRNNSSDTSWIFGGLGAIIFGMLIGYYIMNAVGYIVAWSGSPILGLEGADLTDWGDTIAASFAPYLVHTVGFALMGALFGMGWGYGIGSQPDDTSLMGNTIATSAVIAILGGFILSFLPFVLTLSADIAVLYFGVFNGLILLGYGIASVASKRLPRPTLTIEDSVETEETEIVVE